MKIVIINHFLGPCGSIEVEKILTAVRALNPAERLELARALEHQELSPSTADRAARVTAVRGKYAHVATSSEEFMARKREDLASEN